MGRIDGRFEVFDRGRVGEFRYIIYLDYITFVFHKMKLCNKDSLRKTHANEMREKKRANMARNGEKPFKMINLSKSRSFSFGLINVRGFKLLKIVNVRFVFD